MATINFILKIKACVIDQYFYFNTYSNEVLSDVKTKVKHAIYGVQEWFINASVKT